MNWKTVFRALKNRDMQKRVLIVVGIIVAYRFMSHIPVPLAEPTKLKAIVSSVVSGTDFGSFLNLISGGSLTSFSILLVGMSPFITASIITQLLTKAIPSLEELHKDGESGRRKINQWTRMITVPLAIIQSVAFVYILRQTVLAGNSVIASTSLTDWVVAVAAMTAGSVLLMWLGELITEQGVGNGISLVIFAGIVSQFPKTFATVASAIFNTASSGILHVFNWFTLPVNPVALAIGAALVIASLGVLYALVKINEAQRIITINYAKRVQGNTSYGGIKSILPVKLISANVIPIIFAVAFLSLPAFAGQIIKATGNQQFMGFANTLVAWFQSPSKGSFTGLTLESFIYPTAYFLLVILFTYFYTSIIFNSNEIAENLQKQGGFIDGIRPGQQTETFLTRTVNRLTLFGSLALGIVAILPFIADYLMYHIAGVSGSGLSIGGTGILIVVSVALESLRQINSRALMVTYDDYK